jgi:hypothetical protein
MVNWLRLKAKQLKRFPLHLLIRRLASWEPLDGAEPGYTVVLACMGTLAPLATANVRLAAMQVYTRLLEMILVFDCPLSRIPDSAWEAIRECSRSVRIRNIGYNDWQHVVTSLIKWGWVYSWLSWSLAVAHARTRAVIIHDLDALPLDRRFFESLYDHWLEEGAVFCGISRYCGGGVTEEMHLVRTPELVLDAHYLRERFRPFDLFNKLRLVDGRVVDFDTMLHVQAQSPRCAVRGIDATQYVHPSQVICNYTDFVAGRKSFEGACHSLLMLPYLLYLGGHSAMLCAVGSQLANQSATSIRLYNRRLYIDGITPVHWAWQETLIWRVEEALFGRCRPEVLEYLTGFTKRAEQHRRVGSERELEAVDSRLRLSPAISGLAIEDEGIVSSSFAPNPSVSENDPSAGGPQLHSALD